MHYITAGQSLPKRVCPQLFHAYRSLAFLSFTYMNFTKKYSEIYLLTTNVTNATVGLTLNLVHSNHEGMENVKRSISNAVSFDVN